MSETAPAVIDPVRQRRKLRPGEQKDQILALRSTLAQKNLIQELADRREVTFADMTRMLLRLGLEAYEGGKR